MPIKESVTPQDVVDFLNEALDVDRQAISKVFSQRQICNEDLANHPTIQVRSENEKYSVAAVGVLNGLFGIDEDGWGPICRTVDSASLTIAEFVLVTDETKGK